MSIDEIAYAEACNLAKSIHAQHYREDSPNWRVLPDLRGVISQISNMVSGLTRTDHVFRLSAPQMPRATIRTWRERIGAAPDFPLHAPTSVEQAMVAQIAELEAALAQPPRPIADAAPRGDDFARIVLASGGQQVLLYKEVDADQGNTLHCVASFDGYQADVKISGIPDGVFADALDKADVAMADRVLAQVAELGLAEVFHG